MKSITFNNIPITFKYINKAHNFEKHIHNNCYMIGTFVSGKSTFNIEKQTYNVEGNTICIIPPKLVHACKSFEINNNWQFINFKPTINFLNTLASKLYDDPNLTVSFDVSFIQDDQLSNELRDVLFRTLNEEKVPEEELIELLQILFNNYAIFNKPLENKNEKFEKLFNFLKNEEYDLKTLDFNTMAQVMGMNPYYFHRIFSKNIGLTPQNFINELRVLNATKLINKCDSLSEIAQESGFYDQAYFTKQFKKYHGVTPKNFIKIN